LLFSQPGCFGRFATTSAVQGFNLDISEGKWVREGVFIALYIVPVYPICAFADLFFINSIEFWTGTNPVSGEGALLTGAETYGGKRLPEGSWVLASSRGRDGTVLIVALPGEGAAAARDPGAPRADGAPAGGQ
jgi:hypothetical protein